MIVALNGPEEDTDGEVPREAVAVLQSMYSKRQETRRPATCQLTRGGGGLLICGVSSGAHASPKATTQPLRHCHVVGGDPHSQGVDGRACQ